MLDNLVWSIYNKSQNIPWKWFCAPDAAYILPAKEGHKNDQGCH